MFENAQSKEKIALDKIINKSRVHLYKPIQIAEILYRDRVHRDIALNDLETYRNQSKKWRDAVCKKLVGRISTSSAKFQDNLFEENALPARLIVKLGKINRKNDGIVEKYIYQQFKNKFIQLNNGLNYCFDKTKIDFELSVFINLFKKEPGLRRSVDKIYEIIVYSLFSAIIKAMEIEISIHIKNPDAQIFKNFQDFSKKILGLEDLTTVKKYPAKLFRVGVTNAADRGLDMWANFGLVIQIKHLSLTEELAKDITSSIIADRIIIVCKDAEERIILSLLHQLGWQSKIQSIITLSELIDWYEKALRGSSADDIGDAVLENLKEQLILEFPSSENKFIDNFLSERGYL